jgi:hypothetical protein
MAVSSGPVSAKKFLRTASSRPSPPVTAVAAGLDAEDVELKTLLEKANSL